MPAKNILLECSSSEFFAPFYEIVRVLREKRHLNPTSPTLSWSHPSYASSNLLLLSFTCSIQCVVEAHCCTCQEVLIVGVKFSLLFVHAFYFAPEESSSWLSKECACKKIPGGCCKEGGYQCIARMLLAMPMRCTEEAFWCTYNKKLIVHCSKKSCTV